MRFVPLILSSSDPGLWTSLAPVALNWAPELHPGWRAYGLRGMAVHVIHLPDEAPVPAALEALRHSLGADFLVLPVPHPRTREAGFRLLGDLEALLEAASGRGVKLALKIEAGGTAAVLDLLRQARGEAVGFCWHEGAEDLEAIADRLWCGLCLPGSDLRPLQHLGYRWDMALTASDPESYRAQASALEAAHPPVLFPAEMPTTALGRPVVPEEGLVFGRHWDRS